MVKRNTLGIVMIAKNEEAVLAECLESVRAISDEIIVGDTGSTDRTKAVAAEHGARVIDVPWTNDFAAARNAVLKEAASDWLLHLDADEVVDPENAQAIRALVDADGEGADAIEVTLANYCNQPKAWRWVSAGGSPYRKHWTGYLAAPLCRLFRNRPEFQYREPIHENITESIHEAGGVICPSSILIHHYGYLPPAERPPEKQQLYRDIAQGKTEKQPNSAKAWFEYAQLSAGMGDEETALAASKRAHALAPRDPDAAMTYAGLLLKQGNYALARKVLEPVAKGGDAAPHALAALAMACYREGDTAEALAHAERAVEAGPNHVMAHVALGRASDVEGDPTGAEAAYERAAELATGIESVSALIHAHELRTEGEELFITGQLKEALDLFVKALEYDGEDPFIYNNLGVCLANLGRPQAAKIQFERALRLQPNLPEAKANLEEIG